MPTPDPNEGLDGLDCESLLDLLKVRSRAAKAISEQLDQLCGQEYRLLQEKNAAQEAVKAVLQQLEAKAAE